MNDLIRLLYDALDINQDLSRAAINNNDVERYLELKFHKRLVTETLDEIYKERFMYATPKNR